MTGERAARVLTQHRRVDRTRRWWWLTREGAHARCEMAIERYADGRLFRCSNRKVTTRFCRVHREEPSNLDVAAARIRGDGAAFSRAEAPKP